MMRERKGRGRFGSFVHSGDLVQGIEGTPKSPLPMDRGTAALRDATPFPGSG